MLHLWARQGARFRSLSSSRRHIVFPLFRPFSSSPPSSSPHPSNLSSQDAFSHLSSRSALLQQVLTPTPSVQLAASLRGLVPDHWLSNILDSYSPSPSSQHGSHNRYDAINNNHLPPACDPNWTLPASHHALICNPVFPDKELLADGMDPFHWPGPPFWRRLWTGGTVRWHRRGTFLPLQEEVTGPGGNIAGPDSFIWARKIQCLERIASVSPRVLSTGECDRVDVSIERRCGPAIAGVRSNNHVQDGDQELEFTEIRNLVFLPQAQPTRDSGAGSTSSKKVVKASRQPSISHVLKPTRSLLFRFSALTFNAHAIHLQPDHCRQEEGYPDLLVHGPLSLCLLLSMVEGEIVSQSSRSSTHSTAEKSRALRRRIRSITYRNLAPLFVDQELRLCALQRENRESCPESSLEKASLDLNSSSSFSSSPRDSSSATKNQVEQWDIWIEGPDQGLRVKGRVEVETV